MNIKPVLQPEAAAYPQMGHKVMLCNSDWHSITVWYLMNSHVIASRAKTQAEFENSDGFKRWQCARRLW